MKQSSLMGKAVGLGLLGALAGAVIAGPLSVVKTSLLYNNACPPFLLLGEHVWLTPCGLFFFEEPVACVAGVLISGVILGLFTAAWEKGRAARKQRQPRLRWSFLVPMIFVALFFSVYFAQ